MDEPSLGRSSPPPRTSQHYSSYEVVQEIADWLLARTDLRPKIAIVCGTGMGGVADALTGTKGFKYEEIPHFPKSTAPGHAGRLVFGYLDGVQVVCMQGRFHHYEGYPLWKCSLPVRVVRLCGVSHLIASNAAGGLRADHAEGDVMVIRDHIDFMGFAGNNPLHGLNDERFGPRFLAVNKIYNRELIEVGKRSAGEAGLAGVSEGVFAVVGGPNFETVAELKMLKMCGADAVGMSTVGEVITAHHMGMTVFAFSLITNVCVMEYEDPAEPNHQDVLAIGKKVEPALVKWISGIVHHIHNKCLSA